MTNFTFGEYLDKLYEHDEMVQGHWNYIHSFVEMFTESMLSGSMAEGACICRLAGPRKRLELDKMMKVMEIDKKEERGMLRETSSPGFYKVLVGDKFLPDNKVHNDISLMYNTNTKPSSPSCESIVNSEVQDYYSELAHEKMKAYKIGGQFTDDGVSMVSRYASPDYDDVNCIHLKFWPNMYLPWFQRKRYWPGPEVIIEIYTQGCHLVPKSRNSDCDWRISFSQAEVILSKEQSAFQRKTYMLAKFIYYSDMKKCKDIETDKDIPSYWLKTVFLIMLEETEAKRWKILEEKNCVIEVVRELFQRLAHGFRNQYLPCFFSPEINLLEGFSGEFFGRMKRKCEETCNLWAVENEYTLERIGAYYNSVIPRDPNDQEKIRKIHSYYLDTSPWWKKTPSFCSVINNGKKMALFTVLMIQGIIDILKNRSKKLSDVINLSRRALLLLVLHVFCGVLALVLLMMQLYYFFYDSGCDQYLTTFIVLFSILYKFFPTE